MADGAVQRPPGFLRRDAGQEQGDLARAELLLETYRVTGALQQSGPPRRLVDILNTGGSPAAVMRDAAVENLADPGEAPHRFDILHVRRERILLAVPITDAAPPRHGLEAVEKQPAAATLILPGIEVTGHVYLPTGADPAAVRLLDRRDFLVVTDAEVAQVALGLSRRHQPLVVVNLARVLLYAPAPR